METFLHDDNTDDHANAGLSVVHQSGYHRMKKVCRHRIIEPVTPRYASPSAGLS